MMNKIHLLSLPKFALGIMLLLFAFGSIMRNHYTLLEIFIHDWMDIIVTSVIIYYLFRTLFKKSSFEEKFPITTFALFFFGIYVLYGDLRLLIGLFRSDFQIFEEIFLWIAISSFWVIPLIIITVIVDIVSQGNN